MTTRSAHTSKRPISAIFIGNLTDSLASKSPSSSATVRSGQLPSPPHTNSAGSTSDTSSAADSGSVGGEQHPSTSGTTKNMFNGNHRGKDREREKEDSGSRPYDIEEDEDDYDTYMNGNEEDHTAKLSDDKRGAQPNDHASAIASTSGSTLSRASSITGGSEVSRLRNLADRNRQVLEKLSTIGSGSHLTTPSPSDRSRAPSRLRTSPLPPPVSSAGPSSRISFTRSRLELEIPSGSETERALHSTSSSDDLSTTPPASATTRRSLDVYSSSQSSSSVRDRVRPLSMESPPKPTVRRQTQQDTEPTWSTSVRRPRRATFVEGSEGNLFAEAVADAVGAKKSPRRAPLPTEFRADRRSLDGQSTGGSISPEISTTQPRRSPSRASLPARPLSRAQSSLIGRTSPEYRRTSNSTLASLPQTSRTSRFSTVRESASSRTHQRWASEDSIGLPPEQGNVSPRRYRYEGRGGSAESALGGGLRSVVSEGLRAAGLVRKRDPPKEDTIDDGGGGLFRSKSARTSTSQLSSNGHLARELDEAPQTPPNNNVAERYTRGDTQPSRPATSLGAYHQYPAEVSRTAPSISRTTRATLTLAQPALSARRSPTTNRTYASPSGMIRTARGTTTGVPSPTPLPEHAKLMKDSLGMFESYLSRLTPPASASAPECLQSAESMVQTLVSLNAILRAGASNSLEEQIEAEVSPDGQVVQDTAQIWRKVGGDFRDGLKLTDELTRTMTGFLLGVGRMLKETGGVGPGSSVNSPHVRGLSLDEGYTGRLSDGLGGRSSEDRSHDGRSHDGRSSLDGKRSDEGRRSDVRRSLDGAREDLLRRNLPVRPSTSMSTVREREFDRERELNRERDRVERDRGEIEREEERNRIQQREAELRAAASERQSQEKRPSVFTSFSSRRLFSSTRQTPLASPLSQEASLSNDITSPTLERQASRARLQQPSPEFTRRQPLALPPPLPTLPSESLLNKSTKGRRQRLSTTSTATVRGSSIIIPSGGSYPTAQVTPTTATVSTAPEVPLFRNKTTTSYSLSRAKGVPSISSSSVTNPGTEEREQRKRTLSATSATFDEESSMTPSTSVATVTPPLDSRKLQNARTLSFADGSETMPSASSSRQRRRTVTELFS